MAFFIHPQHGATNASMAEAPDLEKHGWKLSTPEEWKRINGKGTTPAEPEQPEPAKRRGRPPKAK